MGDMQPPDPNTMDAALRELIIGPPPDKTEDRARHSVLLQSALRGAKSILVVIDADGTTLYSISPDIPQKEAVKALQGVTAHVAHRMAGSYQIEYDTVRVWGYVLRLDDGFNIGGVVNSAYRILPDQSLQVEMWDNAGRHAIFKFQRWTRDVRCVVGLTAENEIMLRLTAPGP